MNTRELYIVTANIARHEHT